MKAAQINNYGTVTAIELANDAQEPTPGEGQVVVKVFAASLNRIDTFFRQGGLQAWLKIELPATLGGDFAGVITKLGEGVTKFKVGDEVYGNAGVYRGGGSGSIAEMVIAGADYTAVKPKSLDYIQSAALPLSGASALQGIEEELKLEAGQKILIQGGAGGIGSLAIQIARINGAYVATTVGTDDVKFAKIIGADEVINYEIEDPVKRLEGFDAVFNTANPQEANRLFPILKKGGKFVSMTGQPDQELAKKYGVTAIGQATKTDTEQLTRLSELIDSGKLKAYVAKTFPLEQSKEAFEYFETSHPRGKVVIEIR